MASFLDLIHMEMNRSDEREHSVRHLLDPHSPAACLAPLLTQLNWHGELTDLKNAMPYFAEEVTVTDVRNSLAALGYTTKGAPGRPVEIDQRLMPCLFDFGDDLGLGVLIGREDKSVYAFVKGEYRRLTAAEDWRAGEAFIVTRKDETDAQPGPGDSWVQGILLRFKSTIRQLLIVSFFSNLLAIATPVFVMVTYDKVIGHHSLSTLPMLLLGVIAALLADLALRVIRARLIGSAAGRIDFMLGVSTFKKLMSLPLSHTGSASISTQISRLREFESLRDFFTGPAANAAIELPFVFLLIIAIGFIAPPLAFIPVAAILVYVALGLLWTPKAQLAEKAYGKASSSRQEFLVESLSQMRHVKQSGAEATWLERFRLLSGKACTLQQKVQANNALKDAASQAISSFTALAILVGGAFAVLGGATTVGGLIATMALSWRILGPIQSAFLTGTRLSQIKTSIIQIDRLFRLKEDKTADTSSLLKPEFYGDISFNRVSFRYPAAEDPALIGFTVSIEAGEMLAVAGPNSSGKSTILKLLAGLYRPQAGSISLDGMDLRQITATTLRKYVAYLPQNTHFFYGTIAQNLRFANPGASDQELWASLEEAGIRDTVERLENQLQERIGDIKTEKMPAGFIRRLAVARALVSSAPVILLDEPEQNLDFNGDELFFNLIQQLKGLRTIIIVSHRPSYIRLADKAIYMRDGLIEFAGPPGEVLQKAAAQTERSLTA